LTFSCVARRTTPQATAASQNGTSVPLSAPTLAQTPAPALTPAPTPAPTAASLAQNGTSGSPSVLPSSAPTLLPSAPSLLPSSAPTPAPAPAPAPAPTAASIPGSQSVPPSLPPGNDPAVCREGDLGDGYCDPVNNVPECGWDMGDCCASTCISSANYQCGGSSHYDCQDPDAESFLSASPTHVPTERAPDLGAQPEADTGFAAFAMFSLSIFVALVIIGVACIRLVKSIKNSSGGWFGGLFSGGAGSFSKMRGRDPSEERAVELARFRRMGERSDAYPNPLRSENAGLV